MIEQMTASDAGLMHHALDCGPLRFKFFEDKGVDIRLVSNNRRIGYVPLRNLSHEECEAFAEGYLSGLRIGQEDGERLLSEKIVKTLGLQLHNLQSL